MSLCQGTGAWVYGLSGNSWASDDYIEVLAEANKAAAMSALAGNPADHAQLAVFCDEQALDYLSIRNFYNFFTTSTGHYCARNALNTSGLSWAGYLLSDLGNPKLPNTECGCSSPP